jgi:hypothetical protein
MSKDIRLGEKARRLERDLMILTVVKGLEGDMHTLQEEEWAR